MVNKARPSTRAVRKIRARAKHIHSQSIHHLLFMRVSRVRLSQLTVKIQPNESELAADQHQLASTNTKRHARQACQASGRALAATDIGVLVMVLRVTERVRTPLHVHGQQQVK